MAPPMKVVREQLEILVSCMEQNRFMMKVPSGASPGTIQAVRHKWNELARKLNAVPGGEHKSPGTWRKYWFEFRYKCKKKMIDRTKLMDRGNFGNSNKLLPLTDIEVRVIDIIDPNALSRLLPYLEKNEKIPPVNSESDNNMDDSVLPERVSSPKEFCKSRRKISQESGMEALETSINYWEDALAAFSVGARGGVSGTLALTSPEEAEFCREIQDLLQNAYLLQERCELLFLDQRSVLFRSESGAGAVGEDGAGAGGPHTHTHTLERRRSRLLSNHTASSHTKKEHHSSAESFASAEDQVADLREFDETELVPEIESLELYQTAIKQLEVGIPYRTLRTEVVECSSDQEFLCKLHCLRLAFQHVFKDAAVWAWFVDAGRQVLTDLLLYADKEPKEFLVAYEEMVSWATDAANWTLIENELSSKGVKALTFYDVVLDYILLDAFEDLAAPPASVLAVVRNRWLSDGFKESALTTAVWSVIKAKRRYLQYPDGFMAHFYSISEHLLPVMAWGFLGPQERLRAVCHAFQQEIVGFITDLFSFHKCRYTNVEDLACDIMQHARTRAANITDRLAERL